MTHGIVRNLSAGVLLVCLVTGLAAGGETEQEEFFERYVRPLLVARCHECHGPEAQEGGFRVDRKEPALAGGKRGVAIAPGSPETSLLMRVVRRQGELKMPPSEPLAEAELNILQRWIKSGAHWPDTTSPPRVELVRKERSPHWAFRPIEATSPPAPQQESWIRNPIDRFVLARLEQEGIEPAPEASPETLVRRLYFDLIGLPPSYADVRKYLVGEPTTRYEALVDRLLQRPEFGERWARHWLDIARYSDTAGYREGGEPRLPFAWTYRDYVVRCMNEDTPFNQFILEQLAADQLELSEDEQWKLAAMGLLTVGPQFNYVRHDIIDDRIDVVTRGLMGLTASCARCHDHKYDPVLSEDYYSLYGVFANSREPLYTDLPRVGRSSGEFARYRQFRTTLARRTRQFEQFHARVHREIQEEMRSHAGDYLVYVVEQMPAHRTVEQPSFETERGALRGPTPYGTGGIVRWQHYLDSRDAMDRVFGLWHRLKELDRDVFAAEASGVLEGKRDANPQVHAALREAEPKSMVEVARVYGELLESAHRDWQEALESDPMQVRLPDDEQEELRLVLYGNDAPTAMNEDEAHDCYRDGEFNRYMGLRRELESLFVQFADVAAPRAMVLADRETIVEPRLFARGNATRPGKFVDRRFFHFLEDVDPEQFTQGSGRLELAQAIASPDNPLTARVIVNRVWQWHFGKGLVATASDFGTRSAPPTHPALLDWLAADFIRNGWSLKRLHTLIVNSATYRQSSSRQDAVVVREDPDNRLLSRMNRRRLEVEALRDALLSAGGRLRARRGGPPLADFESGVRSLYLLVNRNELSVTLATFDFPSPDLSTGRRSETTVPPQALFLMNSPFAADIADRITSRLESALPEGDPAQRVEWLFQRILSRNPTPDDLASCRQVLTTANGSRSRDAWRDLAHVLLMSNEFTFVD